MNLGQAIRRLRKQQGMTLAEMAQRCDSHVGNLSRIERGLAKPSLELLYRLAEALNLAVADIFSIAERKHLDTKQDALNAAFVLLPDTDRVLLLEFARLLKRRHNLQPEAGNADRVEASTQSAPPAPYLSGQEETPN
ncbi:helix-turn-helix domain-containing protein [Marinobacter sp.]|uniref:helix-turn-helix domain-containing protein n=1 Tax=Marinobacter sp. TaxID=50741 RepID=UPI0035C6B9EF